MIDSKLTDSDLHFVLTRIPRDVLELMKKERIVLGGGFIRETIAGNPANDIDLFGSNADVLRLLAENLAASRGARLHKTDNAITILGSPRMPIQFITRWLSLDPVEIAKGFDFTVCQAVIWYDEVFKSAISNAFYSDLAARRLVYTNPVREEAAGGSLLRVRKFLQRGYTIQAKSLAGVVTRLVCAINFESLHGVNSNREAAIGQVLTALLHEVDPLLVVDGVEARNEHDPIAEAA